MPLELDNVYCFMCPVTQDVMEDPVITPYGHSYERNALENWLKNNATDPLTSQALNPAMLIENRNLKEAIATWKKVDSDWKEKIKSLQARQKELEQEKAVLEKREISEKQTKTSICGLTTELQYLRVRMGVSARKNSKPFATKSVEDIIQSIPHRFSGQVKDKIYVGLLALFKDDGGQAKEIFEKLPYQQDDWLSLQLGRAYHNMGNKENSVNHYNQAIEHYKLALSQNPNNDEAQRWWGWSLDRIAQSSKGQREKLLGEAIEHYDIALKINPNNEKIYENKGRAFRSLGKEKEALILFFQAIDLGDNRAKTYASIGEIYKGQDDFSSALKYFKKAIDDNPKDEVARFKLGRCHKDYADLLYKKEKFSANVKNSYEKAIVTYKKSLDLNENYGEPYADLGYCLCRLNKNNYPEVRALYQKALTLDPQNKKVIKNLKWLDDRTSQSNQSPNSRNYRHSGNSNHSFYHRSPANRGASSSSPNNNRNWRHGRG